MALKGLSYDNASINLGKGEQHQASYGAVNPQKSCRRSKTTAI